MTAIGVADFANDGRGPVLTRVHWDPSGTVLRAIDYRNAGDAGDAPTRHVRLHRVQVVAITPEELIDYADHGNDVLSSSPPASAFDLGRSEWLESFVAQSLGECRHYRLHFHDQLIDVIAEGIDFRPGAYALSIADPAPLLAILDDATRNGLGREGWSEAIATHYADPVVEDIRQQVALTAHRLDTAGITVEQAAAYVGALAKRLRGHLA